MPTREVLSYFSNAGPQATGVGPIYEHIDHIPQSLLDRHNNLAAKPNKSTCFSPDARRTTPEEQDRVRSTGARTPGSLAAEIRAQIKHRADEKEKKNKDKEPQ
ncbi:hypothetical protein B0T10DRAFT_561318 [Thelonectria olida]|uniref:Uncharacterized protein n=1 Tax=Thelonectria olida TaxID=1576542 RepID=A0A9P8W6V7_9HYPO|nr:hypothetical protein B0T10DRAFT_561318 [Thelonectria olida]